MKRTIGILMTSLLIALSGCGAGEPQTMKLALDSNPTTGYSWTLTQDPELFEVSDEYIENAHEEGMVGVGGQQVFTLTPKESGTTDLTFIYARPWETEKDPETEIVYSVKVSGDMKIKITAMTYGGGNDINELPQIPEPEIK